MAIKDFIEIPCVTKEAHELKEGDVFIRRNLVDTPRLIRVHRLNPVNSDQNYMTFISQEIGSGNIRREFLSTVATCHIIASA